MDNQSNINNMTADKMMKHILHHLRNPNASINGLSKLLQHLNESLNMKDKERDAYLNGIQEAAKKIDQLQSEINLWLEVNKK